MPGKMKVDEKQIQVDTMIRKENFLKKENQKKGILQNGSTLHSLWTKLNFQRNGKKDKEKTRGIRIMEAYFFGFGIGLQKWEWR